MSDNLKWTLGGEPPEAAEFPAEKYEDQQAKDGVTAIDNVRAYDERGNVRPADERFTDNPEGDKPKPAKKAAAKKAAASEK